MRTSNLPTSSRVLVAFALSFAANVGGCQADPPRLGLPEQCLDASPPAIILQTLGGDQTGAQGSYCTVRPGTGCGRCLDRAVEPQLYTVIHPGDELSFSMARGALVAGERCNPACPPTLRIERAACHAAETLEVLLHEDHPWSADLQPGAYWLWVDSNFDAEDGLAGKTYSGFGLIVEPAAERTITDAGVLGAPTTDAGCSDAIEWLDAG